MKQRMMKCQRNRLGNHGVLARSIISESSRIHCQIRQDPADQKEEQTDQKKAGI